MLTLEQAKELSPGDRVHYTGRQECTRKVGPRGGVTAKIVECRVSGQPTTWKRTPSRVQVPVKFGMYENSYITESNLHEWHLASECPLNDTIIGEGVPPSEIRV